MSTVAFEQVIGSVDELMGVKAVFGPLNGRAICFASRGNAALKDRNYFRSARVAAEYAAERPYLVMIGGGAQVRDNLGGRVVNIAKVSKAYGETPAFTCTPATSVTSAT